MALAMLCDTGEEDAARWRLRLQELHKNWLRQEAEQELVAAHMCMTLLVLQLWPPCPTFRKV